MGHSDASNLLDMLEKKRTELPHVVVIISGAQVWVKKYAWFAEGPAPSEPKESPCCTDQFFLAVRNPSIKTMVVAFECVSRHGRIRFDKSSTDGFKFTETIKAVATPPGALPAPVVRNSRIEVMETGEASDVIDIKAQTHELLSANQLGEAEARSLVVYFS